MDTTNQLPPDFVKALAPDDIVVPQEILQAAADDMNILLEADKIITGDREATYGKFDKNLQAIADMWNTYLVAAADADGNIVLSARDVCMMMVLLKVAREANKHKEDNLVDICGYTALAHKIAKKEAREGEEEHVL